MRKFINNKLNNKDEFVNRTHKTLMMLLIASTLTACSGGGGGSDSAPTTTPDPAPAPVPAPDPEFSLSSISSLTTGTVYSPTISGSVINQAAGAVVGGSYTLENLAKVTLDGVLVTPRQSTFEITLTTNNVTSNWTPVSIVTDYKDDNGNLVEKLLDDGTICTPASPDKTPDTVSDGDSGTLSILSCDNNTTIERVWSAASVSSDDTIELTLNDTTKDSDGDIIKLSNTTFALDENGTVTSFTLEFFNYELNSSALFTIVSNPEFSLSSLNSLTTGTVYAPTITGSVINQPAGAVVGGSYALENLAQVTRSSVLVTPRQSTFDITLTTNNVTSNWQPAFIATNYINDSGNLVEKVLDDGTICTPTTPDKLPNTVSHSNSGTLSTLNCDNNTTIERSWSAASVSSDDTIEISLSTTTKDQFSVTTKSDSTIFELDESGAITWFTVEYFDYGLSNSAIFTIESI